MHGYRRLTAMTAIKAVLHHCLQIKSQLGFVKPNELDDHLQRNRAITSRCRCDGDRTSMHGRRRQAFNSGLLRTADKMTELSRGGAI